ncbi:MAG: hypothetical protein WCV62_01930 [Candidatus Peribacteraceae bacterium]|jgi:hypothetical protein
METVPLDDDKTFEACKTLGRLATFHPPEEKPKISQEMENIRTQLRRMWLGEYLHSEYEPSTGEECREVGTVYRDLVHNDRFNARWDEELKKQGYSDTALDGTTQVLKQALAECCAAVNEATDGEAGRAHDAMWEAILSLKGAGPAIDRAHPFLLQVFGEWTKRGYTLRDLHLLS